MLEILEVIKIPEMFGNNRNTGNYRNYGNIRTTKNIQLGFGKFTDTKINIILISVPIPDSEITKLHVLLFNKQLRSDLGLLLGHD